MRRIHATLSPLEARRLCNFLASRGVEATIRTSPAQPETSSSEVVCAVEVPQSDEALALRLLDEFRAVFDAATDDPQFDAEDQAPPSNEPAPTRKPFPWLTLAFCLIALGLSRGLQREPDALSTQALHRWGWRDPIEIADGEIWGVISSVPLHQSMEHLLLNLAGIALLGVAIERSCGRWCWLLLFFAAALISWSATVAALGAVGPGASGVLYAFFGFVLAASSRRRLISLWLLVPLSMWLLYGTIRDIVTALHFHLSGTFFGQIAVHSHLGGLLVGVLAALAFVVRWRPWVSGGLLAAILFTALVPLRGAPWVPEWCLARAEHAMRDDDMSGAIEWSSKAIARRPSSGAYLYRGVASFQQADIDAASADFDAALEMDSAAPNVRVYRAMVRVLHSDIDGAMDDVRSEIAEVGGSSFAFGTRAWLHESRQEFEEALRDYDQAIALDPRSGEYRAQRAALHLTQCRFDDARADLDRVLEPGRAENVAWVRGSLFAEQARFAPAHSAFERAREVLRAALHTRPRDVWRLQTMGIVGLSLFDIDREDGHLEEALEHVDRARSLVPVYWSIHELRAAIRLEQRVPADAEQDASRAIEFNSRAASAYAIRGVARHHLKRDEEAIVDLDRAVELNPRVTETLRNRALVRRALGRDGDALDDLNQAIQLNPHDARALWMRGRLRLALNQRSEGEADLQRATELLPKPFDEELP